MGEFPDGLDSTPRPPHQLYSVLRDLAPKQVSCLTEMVEEQGPRQGSRAAQFLSFWARTLPAALDLQFDVLESPVATTLRELERVVPPVTSQ